MKIQMKYPALACCVMMLTTGCSQNEAISSSYANENNARVPLTIASAGSNHYTCLHGIGRRRIHRCGFGQRH